MDESLNTLTTLIIVLAIYPLARAFFQRPTWSTAELPRSRIAFFDILRGLAIIAVVGIHAVDYFRDVILYQGVELLAMNAFLRFAIPLFLIASGFLLDPNDCARGSASFYKRKVVRIFVPYILVTAAYFFFTEPWSASALLLHIIRGDILIPYYFVVVLLALYLMYPLLVRFAPSPAFLPVTLALSVAAALFNVRWFFGVPLPFEFIFFFAYGIAMRPYLYGHSDRPTLMPWLLIAFLYVAGFVAYPAYYYNALFFWGTAVFTILFAFREHVERAFGTLIPAIGTLSLWIFLVHYPILHAIGNSARGSLESVPPLLGAVLLMAASVVVSYAVSYSLAGAYKAITSKFSLR